MTHQSHPSGIAANITAINPPLKLPEADHPRKKKNTKNNIPMVYILFSQKNFCNPTNQNNFDHRI